MSRLLNRLFATYICLACFSFLLPWDVRPVPSFYHDALAIFALIAGVGLLGFFPKVEFRLPSAALLPLALVVVIALQTQNGFMLWPTDGFFPIVELLCFALAIMYGATLVAEESDLDVICLRFAGLFVIVGFLSVVLQHIQLAVVDVPLVMPAGSHHAAFRPYANLGQPNLLALTFCCSLASVWWLYSQNKISIRNALAVAVILLWGLALTQSRIAWMILPTFTLLCWFQPANSAPVSRRLLVGFLILFAGMVFLVPAVLQLTGLGMETLAQRAAHSSERIILWQEAWAMSTMHPWFGVGWSQFNAHQVQLAFLFKPAEASDYAHNIVLNFAAEMGWPVTVLIVVAAAYWFSKCCISRWSNPQIRFISLIIIAILLHSMVEFPLWNAIFLVPFGVLIGAVHRSDMGMRRIVIARGWIILFFAVAVTAFTFVFWDFQRIAHVYKVALQQDAAKDTAPPNIDKPDFTLFAPYYDFLKVGQIRVYSGMPVQDIAFLEKVSLSFGYPPVFGRLALAYAVNGRPREALQVMITNQRLHETYYPKSYQWWGTLAKQNPALFAEIFRRLPIPERDMNTDDDARAVE